ncbi:hypothetical protein BDK51DRAFT_48337 [Blyttiomyces helicus]|uniref:Uncharacterized protein n=1 Tax=Blyttiomyces helicus TaxID=388810 RepID=A0A4P9W1S0_9FUNG|nr:hypothetical protein BDK51DRAFT_48337 [Blyttiomyces helicus]|eukprot:RKO86054.1 hypothetical protein BDK51DRAFT_48337 [Blyttiomyces helicus]
MYFITRAFVEDSSLLARPEHLRSRHPRYLVTHDPSIRACFLFERSRLKFLAGHDFAARLFCAALLSPSTPSLFLREPDCGVVHNSSRGRYRPRTPLGFPLAFLRTAATPSTAVTVTATSQALSLMAALAIKSHPSIIKLRSRTDGPSREGGRGEPRWGASSCGLYPRVAWITMENFGPRDRLEDSEGEGREGREARENSATAQCSFSGATGERGSGSHFSAANNAVTQRETGILSLGNEEYWFEVALSEKCEDRRKAMKEITGGSFIGRKVKGEMAQGRTQLGAFSGLVSMGGVMSSELSQGAEESAMQPWVLNFSINKDLRIINFFSGGLTEHQEKVRKPEDRAPAPFQSSHHLRSSPTILFKEPFHFTPFKVLFSPLMRSFELALATLPATTSVTGQGFSTPAAVQLGISSLIGGLPGTYPATYAQQPSPTCLNAITSALAAASTTCALNHLPSPSFQSNSLNINFNEEIQNLEVFSTAFCTTACGAALKNYASAVVAGCGTEQIFYQDALAVYPGDIQTLLNEQVLLTCSQDPSKGSTSSESNCGVIQMNIAANIVKSLSFSSNTTSQLFCNPCGAQNAKAYQSIAAAKYADTTLDAKFGITANKLAGIIASCPGGPPTPVADGVLSATAVSGAPASNSSSNPVTSAGPVVSVTVPSSASNSSSASVPSVTINVHPSANNSSSRSTPGATITVNPSASNSSSGSKNPISNLPGASASVHSSASSRGVGARIALLGAVSVAAAML